MEEGSLLYDECRPSPIGRVTSVRDVFGYHGAPTEQGAPWGGRVVQVHDVFHWEVLFQDYPPGMGPYGIDEDHVQFELLDELDDLGHLTERGGS